MQFSLCACVRVCVCVFTWYMLLEEITSFVRSAMYLFSKMENEQLSWARGPLPSWTLQL